MFRTQLIRAETKVLDLKAGRVFAVVSTEARDRQGDIIRQDGWDLTSFHKHPVLLSSHNYLDLRSQIGEWEDVKVEGKKLVGIAHYYVGEGNEQADWAFNLAGKGRAAFSVGFKADMEKAKELETLPGSFRQSYEFRGQELLEVSQVVIPANAQALQAIRTLGLDPILTSIADEMQNEMPPEIKLLDYLPLYLDVVGKPYPNEHACRLRDPGDFKPESFRRTEREHEGKKYSCIMGRLKGEETMTEQAYRYPKGIWPAGSARSHCKSHDGNFEAASEEAAWIPRTTLSEAVREAIQETLKEG